MTWSPLYGSIAALVCMHSLMEYIVVVMYLFIGFSIPTVGHGKRSAKHRGLGDEESGAPKTLGFER